MNRNDDLFNWRDEADDHLLFGDENTEFFFDEGNRGYYIEQLEKLAKLDEVFVFVQGENGVGKTSLLREFVRQHQTIGSCIYLEVPILVDTITLLDDICKQSQIDAPLHAGVDEYIHAIRTFIQSQYQHGKPFNLVIDDADGLPEESLRAILKLISKSGSPHFIFSSHDNTLKSRLSALVPFYQTHTIELLPLSEAEVVSYVNLYLSAYQIENEFSDDDIYDIYLSSNGNINEINKIISATVDQQMETDSADYLERTQKISTLNAPRLHIFAVALAVLALGGLSIFFMLRAPSHSTTSYTSSNPSINTDTTTTAPTNSNTAEATVLPNTTTNDQPASSNVVVTNDKPIATIAPTAPPKASATPPAKTPTALPTTSKASGSWLTSAPASHFTLQIMSSDSKDSVTKLISQQSNPKEWAQYQTTRNGKPWFVAVYGNYASKEAAKAAADKLPPGLKEGKPWPKAISVIRDEMKR